MSCSASNTTTEFIQTIECADGYCLRFRVWKPQIVPKKTLFLLNGLMSHSGWFRKLAVSLSAFHEMKVIGADRRGSGLNDRERGDVTSSKILISDLARIISQEDCGVPIYIVGWCWGAVLAILTALDLGHKVSGIALLAPGLFPSNRIRQAAETNLKAIKVSGDFSPLIRSPLTEEFFTDIEEFRAWIASDDRALRTFTPRFFRVTQQMMLAAAAGLTRLTQPVLILLADKDRAVDNQKTLAMFARHCPAEITSKVLPCHHAMQFEAPSRIAIHISEWLRQQSLGAAVREYTL